MAKKADNPHRKFYFFLWKLHESLEGLNSSVAQAAGEL